MPEQQPENIIDQLFKMLEQLETHPAQAWELLGSVPAREGPLAREIRAAALRTLDESSVALGSQPTALLRLDKEKLDLGGCEREMAGGDASKGSLGNEG